MTDPIGRAYVTGATRATWKTTRTTSRFGRVLRVDEFWRGVVEMC